jgi:hypothetical protein
MCCRHKSLPLVETDSLSEAKAVWGLVMLYSAAPIADPPHEREGSMQSII